MLVEKEVAVEESEVGVSREMVARSAVPSQSKGKATSQTLF